MLMCVTVEIELTAQINKLCMPGMRQLMSNMSGSILLIRKMIEGTKLNVALKLKQKAFKSI